MEVCERCGIGENRVKLFDVIFDNRSASLCERCSIIENATLLKQPSTNQLLNSEKNTRVYDRMVNLAGMRVEKKADTYFREDRLKELEKNPKLELPDMSKLNLVDNYHWEIMRYRRRKGYTIQQLSKTLGVSEMVLGMIEKGKLPENADSVLIKIEQFFMINLRKLTTLDRINKQRSYSKPVLIDEFGRELEIIPEEEMEILNDEFDNVDEDEIEQQKRIRDIESVKKVFNDSREKMIRTEISLLENKEVLDLRQTSPSQVTIGDLRNMHRKKIEASKSERFEEQRKIEERRRLLEAQREKDHLKMEERKAQEQLLKQSEKQKTEELRKKLIEEKKQELKRLKEKESRNMDKYLGGSELLE